MKNAIFKIFVILVTLSLTVVGCGGGSSDGATSSSSSNTTAKPNSTSTTDMTQTTLMSGSLSVVDAGGVSGLRVECSSGETTTALDGSFECAEFPINVYLNDFKLGEVDVAPFDNTIYTQDLVGVPRGATAHEDVTKLSMILQSLDNDAQPLNGITLAEDTLSLLSADLSSDTNIAELSFEDVKHIIQDVIATRAEQDDKSMLKAVSPETAQSNLTVKTAKAPALTTIQRSAGRSL